MTWVASDRVALAIAKIGLHGFRKQTKEQKRGRIGQNSSKSGRLSRRWESGELRSRSRRRSVQ